MTETEVEMLHEKKEPISGILGTFRRCPWVEKNEDLLLQKFYTMLFFFLFSYFFNF